MKTSFLSLCLLFLAACSALKPGADPLVIRAEQTETIAKSTFDATLGIDHADRGFWRTNAPAFHGFCEWLRVLQPINARGDTMPRASAMIYSLDVVKRDYQVSKSSSNAVYSAIATLLSAVNQATGWIMVATNNPH